MEEGGQGGQGEEEGRGGGQGKGDRRSQGTKGVRVRREEHPEEISEVWQIVVIPFPFPNIVSVTKSDFHCTCERDLKFKKVQKSFTC